MITLNDAEQKLAIYLARKRYEQARGSGVKNARVGPQSDEMTDLEGIAAEIAFCRMFNVYPDTDGSYGVADCWTVERGGVDVKTTRYRNGRLIAVRGKATKPPDSYALMIGEFPTYRFVGFADADDLLREENLTSLGYGPVYCLDQSRLEP